MGVASMTGRVRDENQDYVLAFTVAGRQVLVMADDPAVRANRLAQLRELTVLLGGLGDFSRLPVQQS